MKAVRVTTYGGPEVLEISEILEPPPGPEQLLVRVHAAGINRADCHQRAGNYPMPPGLGNVLGLELAGEVIAIGKDVNGFTCGDRVFGLVAEGAYAEVAVLDQGLAVPIPDSWSFAEGAAVIEVFCTANETVFELGRLLAGQSILVHAGASGVGTAVVQMAKNIGATVLFTAGSRIKIDKVLELGADHGIPYKTHDFVEEVLRSTDGEGVDVVEDFVGADYISRNLGVLKPEGRLVLVGTMGGQAAQFKLGSILRKRLSIHGFTLRAQSIAQKRAIVGRFRERWLTLLAEGTIRPIIHTCVPFNEVRHGHQIMEANENFGKIVLTFD